MWRKAGVKFYAFNAGPPFFTDLTPVFQVLNPLNPLILLNPLNPLTVSGSSLLYFFLYEKK